MSGTEKFTAESGVYAFLNEDTSQYSMTFDGANDYVLGYYNNCLLTMSLEQIFNIYNCNV